MSFDEFVRAKGNDVLADVLLRCEWPTITALAAMLEGMLREYYFVGGMPEAVLNFVTNGQPGEVRNVQRKILRAYENDIGKHAGNETNKVRMVWQSMVSQLSKENKKFIYGAVRKGARSRDLENAIQWLVDAGLVYKVHRCLKPTSPLPFYKDPHAFKLYMLDVGLLGVMAGATAKQLLLPNQGMEEYKGAMTENYVVQQAMTIPDLPLFYYSKDNSTMEIDLLVQAGERIVPVEVKAEENVRSKSLAQFVKVEYADRHLKGLRCSMKPYEDQGWMENIPLYGVGGYLRQK